MHLLFWLYIVALLSGSASIAIALSAYTRNRKPVVLHFAAFLGSLALIVTSMTVQSYRLLLPPGDQFGATLASLVIMVLGAGGYMFVAPYFYHSLVGERVIGWRRVVYLALAAGFVLLSLSIFVWPTFRPTLIALNVLLFGMVAYGIGFIALRYRRIGDRRLRRAVRTFLVISVVFFPLMYLDSIVVYLPPIPIVDLLDGSALPLFFLTLNVIAVRFASTYLSDPAYLSQGKISGHFRDVFGINEREGEIIRMLMDGRTSREVADHLFISAKTVENHVSSIYQKTRVRNRVELVNLILEHRGA